MDGAVVAQSYGYSELNELSRRGSKRRRLLAHRLPEDSNNPQLEWPSTQQAPNFFNVTASTPSRMDEGPGVVPVSQPGWNTQSGTAPNFGQYNDAAPYAGHPYYYGQDSGEAYPQSWPTAQGLYDNSTAPAYSRAQSVQEQASRRYQDGVQYLDPQGGTEVLYNASAPNSYTAATMQPAMMLQATAYPQPVSVRFADTALQSLNDLDNLATRLIQTVARLSLTAFQNLMQGTSEESRDYLAIVNLFDQVRKRIAPNDIFIDVSVAQNFSPPQQDIIRKANTATFITSILASSSVSLFHLNQAFLEIFVPLGHRLLKWQGAIYLDLKTQTYIMAAMNNDNSPESLLDELFPVDLDSRILQRHSDAPSLSPSEQDFVDRCKARRHYLLAESSPPQMRVELPKKYQWTDFIREFSSSISKNVDHILSASHRQSSMHGVMNRRRAGSGPGSYNGIPTDSRSLADVRRTVSNSGHRGEKKVAANGQTIRQAWVKQEEEALIAGLERVGGPHWSQILALYGRGGSISEVLKDRNQVQLKDKARNLKLWYLKMGQEVPVSLRGVTGELRKRGGARARAALEAEEQQGAAARERRSSDSLEHDLDPTLSVRHDTVDPGSYDRTLKR